MASLLALASPLSAGDKITITGPRTQTGPVLEKKDPTGLNKPLDGLIAPSLYDGLGTRRSPRRASELSRTEKQQRMERDEKANWALLAPGELQKEQGEEFNFGVKEYSLDGFEKKSDTRDYTFHGLGRSRRADDAQGSAGGARPGQSNPSAPQAEARQAEEEAESSRSRTANSLRLSANPQEGPAVGAHVSKDLDLQGLLGGSGPNPLNTARPLGGAESRLNSLVGNPTPAMQNSDYENRLQNFRQLLNGPRPASREGGLFDPASGASAGSRQPWTPPSVAPAFSIANPLGSPSIQAPGPLRSDQSLLNPNQPVLAPIHRTPVASEFSSPAVPNRFELGPSRTPSGPETAPRRRL